MRAQLADPVALRQRGEHRLVVAAADDLDLAAIDEDAQALDECGSLARSHCEERPGVVERRDADARVPLERLEHRQVRRVVDLGEHPAEVADRLVVVEDEGEGDAGATLRQPASVTTGACTDSRTATPAAGR